MRASLFKGLPSIQEVECRGRGLEAEVTVVSLQVCRASDGDVLASLNVFTNTCLAYGGETGSSIGRA